MPGVRSQEKSQQNIAESLERIEGLLRRQADAMALDGKIVERRLHCGMHASRHEEGYIQTDDGTQWEFRAEDSLSVEDGCLMLQTAKHDGRGGDGHATIILPLSRIAAMVIT